MPLTINLLHEERRRRRQRARDPLKIAFAFLLLLTTGLVAYQTRLGTRVSELNRRIEAGRAALNRESALSREAAAIEPELTRRIDTRRRVLGSIRERVFWAPALAVVTQCTRPDIGLTRLAGSTVDAKLGRVMRLEIQGVAAGHEPRAIAEAFKVALQKEFGRAHPDSAASILTLADLPEPRRVDGRDLAQARFEITCNIPVSTDAEIK